MATSPTTCPICQRDNQCAMALGGTAASCWCHRGYSSASLMAHVPQHLKGKACICTACAQARTAALKTVLSLRES
jgi:hypothetical protein